jgi:hypothetical protein
MRQVLILLIPSTICLTGCFQSTSGSVDSHTVVPYAKGVLGALRPKADPKLVDEISKREALEKISAQSAQNAVSVGSISTQRIGFFGLGRALPKVITDPIAPAAEDVAKQSGPIVTSANDSNNKIDGGADNKSVAPASSGQAQIASYGNAYNNTPSPPPGALAGGLIPPPPAVTLSTQAQAAAYAPGQGTIASNPYSNNPYANPYAGQYANPYANPYLNPYGIQYQQGTSQPAQIAPARPAGSPFSTGGGNRSVSDGGDDNAKPKKAAANFVPITPTGMESRSPYKQRDDLKILWKGYLATSSDIKPIVKDAKMATQISQIEVGLPSEATKGSFEVSQRQIDSIFKLGALDKRIVPTVKKCQKDLFQAYMRYLYSYNKFALAQQSMAARKQEIDVADSPSESQRAAADLAQAQTDAESTRDDMKSAQSELVATAGASAARTIIGHVSGVTPTLDSLAQASEKSADESGSAAKNNLDVLGSVTSLFSFHHHKDLKKESKTADEKDADTTSSDDSPQKADSSKNNKAAKIAKARKGAELADSDKGGKKLAKDMKAKVKVKNGVVQDAKLAASSKNSKSQDGEDLRPAPNSLTKADCW